MARDYNIAKASNACRLCNRELAAGEEYVAVLFDEGEAFRREDFCAACWEQRGEQGAFSVWRGKVQAVEEVKKTFVDDDVLVDFFTKLGDKAEPAKVNFRFVLALMLMRKKILLYDASRRGEAAQEIWSMHLKGESKAVDVIHPELDDSQIAEVTTQLNAILESPT